MKKFAMQFLHILSFAILFSTSLFSMPPNPEITTSSTSNGEYQFGVSQLPAGVTSAFWILGDGHFRTGLAPSHNFRVNNGNDAQAFLLSPYIILPPTRVTCNTSCNINSTSNLPNYQVAMNNQSAKIGTSWNPTRGQKFYTIFTIENVDHIKNGSVIIRFNSPVNENVSSINVRQDDNSYTWFDNLNFSNNGSIKEITFNFADLNFGEQRHLLIETVVDFFALGNEIVYAVEMRNKENDIFYQANPTAAIRRYPHDPNNKEVSKDYICAYNNEVIELEYRIDFQNEGTGYAEIVRVKDVLPNHLDYTSFQFVSSSHSCQVIRTGNNLEFIFDHISLPGLNQTHPHIPHPNETKGFIIFTIEAEPCLSEMVIENEANIYFDEQPVITTPMATTEAIYDDNCLANNISCDPVDDGTGSSGPPPMGFVLNDTGLEVYPNPVQDQFYIDFEIADNAPSVPVKLAVYNVHGQMLVNLSNRIEGTNGRQHLSVDASDWPNGIYFVKLEDNNAPRIWKIVKNQE